jgi:flagellar biosynthetic protein FliQ
MNIEQSIEILRSLVSTSLLVIAPILIVAVLVGVAVSLFQSVTSIQEQTLTFVPKVIAVGLVIVFTAPWMLRQMMQFAIAYLSHLPDMVR